MCPSVSAVGRPLQARPRKLGSSITSTRAAHATSRPSRASARPTRITPSSPRDVRAGIHTPESKSPTVATAARLWLESGEAAKLERTTLMSYQANLDLHIVPLIGTVKLSALTVPMARAFEDRLRADRSPAMVRRVMGALGSILADAQERGLVAQNVVRSLRGSRRRDKDRHADKRQKGKLKVGVDIPTPEEIKAIIAHLSGRWRPLLLTAIFTGLRASELRGLRWADVALKLGELHVRQRADRYNAIGRPKSAAGERTIPLAPMLVNTLREWKLACPKSELDLAFPTAAAASNISRTSSNADFGRRRLRQASLTKRVSRNIPGYTACATSTPHGASIAASTAASNCRSSWSKAASGTRPST